jgi:hypothetical protein
MICLSAGHNLLRWAITASLSANRDHTLFQLAPWANNRRAAAAAIKHINLAVFGVAADEPGAVIVEAGSNQIPGLTYRTLQAMADAQSHGAYKIDPFATPSWTFADMAPGL